MPLPETVADPDIRGTAPNTDRFKPLYDGRLPLLLQDEHRDCLTISGLYMYKDQGLTEAERWEKVRVLVNKKLKSFKKGQDLWPVEKVMWYYEAGLKDEDWLRPHRLHKLWENKGVDNVEVKAKIAEYRELEKQMDAGGAV